VVGLTFVVRCDGRADSTTIVVVSATDSAFVAPAIRAVLQSIYRPAVFRGQKVATTVPQSVRFKAESLP
jgi:small basic protein